MVKSIIKIIILPLFLTASIIIIIVLALFLATSDVLAEAHHRPSDDNTTVACTELMTVTIAVQLWIMTELASTLTTIAAALATTVGWATSSAAAISTVSVAVAKTVISRGFLAAVPAHNDTKAAACVQESLGSYSSI